MLHISSGNMPGATTFVVLNRLRRGAHGSTRWEGYAAFVEAGVRGVTRLNVHHTMPQK